jgi:hypothetical protein
MTNNENTHTQQTASQKEVVPATKQQSWKSVTIGAASGILMGAGTYFAANTFADNGVDVQSAATLKVATTHDDMNFADAFAAARHEVGAGGIFSWHGGLFNTYTKAEWDAMSNTEKELFAQQVKPQVEVHEITPNQFSDSQQVNFAAETESAGNANGRESKEIEVVTFNEDTQLASAKAPTSTSEDDVEVMTDTHNMEASSDVDVQIIGTRQMLHDDGSISNVAYGTVDGHSAIIIDVNANGHADVAAVDMNDNNVVDRGEIVDLNTGQEIYTSPSVNDENSMMASESDGNMDAATLDTDYPLI